LWVTYRNFVSIARFVEVTGFTLFQVRLIMQCHISVPHPAERGQLVFITDTDEVRNKFWKIIRLILIFKELRHPVHFSSKQIMTAIKVAYIQNNTNWWRNYLTTRSTALVQKLTVYHILKNFTLLYGNRRFTGVLISP
jgi:hypothetical protein